MTTKVPVTIRATLILARSPIVVPELTKFESQYIKYKYELEKRLMWTFPAYYYFKKGTMSEYKFQSAQKKPISKRPGVWYPQGIPDLRYGRDRSTKQEVIIPKDENTSSDTGVSRPIVKNSIITKADKFNDTTSLERKLRNTLYLLVRNKPSDQWKFPSFQVNSDQALHEVAESGLRDIGGSKINTWTVSRKPVKVLENEKDRVFEFFIKSRILTGEFVPKSKDIQFKWLTRDEIKDFMSKDYYDNTVFLLDK